MNVDLAVLPWYNPRMDTTLTRIIKYKYDPVPLVTARKSKKLSQADVATALSVNLQTIYRIEKGLAASYELVASYCTYLGLDAVDVIGAPLR